MIKSALASSMILVGLIASPALAHPLVIASLSEDTILPAPVTSDAALASAYRAHASRYDDAARQMGLSATERARIGQAFSSGHAQPVSIPRHLAAMSEYRDGRVQILHDVIIPPNESGYVVSVNEPNGVLNAYIPKACGNLSYVRTSTPRVAAAHVKQASRPLVAAAHTYAEPAPRSDVPSYASPGYVQTFEQPVAYAVPVPVPVYVEPAYRVRVYEGARYYPAPHVIVRAHEVYGYSAHGYVDRFHAAPYDYAVRTEHVRGCGPRDHSGYAGDRRGDGRR